MKPGRIKEKLLLLGKKQIIRFFLVGGINTVVSYGAYSLFIVAGAHFTLATFLQLAVSIAFNYFAFGNFVFRKGGKGTLPRFLLVCALQYALYTGGIWILDKLGIGAYFSGALMIVPVVLISFFLHKNFTFKQR